MMRKNKFVNPIQKVSDREDSPQSPDNKTRNYPLMQNKIYFPSSYQDRLMPYKPQPNQQKNKLVKVKSNQLYDIKERRNGKDGIEKKMSFGRENKFEKVESRDKPNTEEKQGKGLLKYKTIELKNLPGISYTMSGATIYRSKNIKSFGKMLIDRSVQKRRRSQFHRNSSMRNQQSVESGIPKSKSNKQTTLKQMDKNFMLYQTYFSSKSGLNLKNNHFQAFGTDDFIQEDKEEIKQNPQDILLAKVIQSQLYQSSNECQQQFF